MAYYYHTPITGTVYVLGGLVDHKPKPRVALEAAEAHRLATVPRPYLAYISHISRLYLPERRRRTASPALMLTLRRPLRLPLTPTPTPEPHP